MKRLKNYCFNALILIAAAGAPSAWAETTEQPRGLGSITVPEGFVVEIAAPSGLVDYPMCAAFDEQGRLFIAESSGKDLSGEEMAAAPECTIRLLEDIDGDGVFDTKKTFADKLSLPMGVLWHQGALFVASPPEFLRFDDTDDDGVADKRTVIHSGWKVLNTASLHGPFLGPDGWLYLTHGRHGYKITTKEGETLEGLAPRIWRCLPDGSRLERVLGGGFDNPVEMIFTPPGEMIGTMTYFTDPRNGQRDALMHWVEGGVYSKPHPSVSEFKRTGDFMPVMTKFARIAPAGLERYRGVAFGPEYQGNLFSAQFNPHRVQRHVLIREGATFRTEDSDFLTSTDPDFHPTDVIEDADGSLLVVETGGWYVDACPVSRVAKPDVRGAVYRVRRSGAVLIENPRGNGMDWDDASAVEIAGRLNDDRLAVRDRAIEALIAKGEDSITPLRHAFRRAKTTDARVAAFWALYRIGGEGAGKTIRDGLKSNDPHVQQAAARAAGLSRDEDAIDRLAALARKGEPAVRRQAATALGQIGDARAAGKLLSAARNATERHIEHAIMYSLIQLANAEPMLAALEDRDPRVRKAALVALDQMDKSPLEREHIAPFIASENDGLRRAGLWVASHHPDWSGEVIEYLESQLTSAEFDPEAAGGVREALVAFANNQDVQALIGSLLTGERLPSPAQIFLMNAIDRSEVAGIPVPWVAPMADRLESPDAEVRARAIALVRSRGADQFDDALARTIDDPAQPPELRLAALAAILPRKPALDAGRFELALVHLAPGKDPGLRLAAAEALARAELTGEQQLRLAGDALAQADALTLPKLLDAFEGASGEQLGEAIVGALLASNVNPNAIGEERISKLIEAYPPPVRERARPIIEAIEAEKQERVNKLAELEPLLGAGDVGRGRRVFFGAKAACSTCHAIGNEGGTLGPDLTSIGQIRSGRDILEAVLFPSASFVQGYEPYRIELENDMQAGVIADQTPEAIYLRTGADTELRIERDAIRAMEPSAVSTMPEGLDAELTREELIDLMAFLQAQNGEQWLLPKQREKP